MALDSYLLEKACYVPEGLSRVAEELHLLPAASPEACELSAYLNVALRHGLMTCCAVSGAEFKGDWVVDLSRKGNSLWKREVKPALEDVLFGPDERDERIKASGLPRDHDPAAEPRDPARRGRNQKSRPISDLGIRIADYPASVLRYPKCAIRNWQSTWAKASWKSSQKTQKIDNSSIEVAELLPRATRCLAALLDLAEKLRKHRCYDMDDGRFRSHLAHAFNGSTKVIATLIDAEWKVGWPRELAERGRAALDHVLTELQKGDQGWRLLAEELGPLDEAWLAEEDPERTPEAEMEAERKRRARVTDEDRIPHDLIIPKRYRDVCLNNFLINRVPGHQACFEYAKNPWERFSVS